MHLFIEDNQHVVRYEAAEGAPIPDNTIWIDLLNPTREEEKLVEAFLCMEIPTREEMHEIEVSSRLRHEDGNFFMTASMVTKVDTSAPETHAVTFILTDHVFVSIRYVDATSFRRFVNNAPKLVARDHDGISLFLGLIESVVDRMADILERLDRDIDRITKDIFRNPEKRESGMRNTDYLLVLDRIGRCGDLSSKIHESMVTYGRVMAFASHHKKLHLPEYLETLDVIRKDITGLTDHCTYLTGRVQFLLDATLGMISIQQNVVFKVLSILSLVLMPPTLVAGIYGMNFHLIPELDWHWGYPLSLLLMLFVAILPYAYLKKRKYL